VLTDRSDSRTYLDGPKLFRVRSSLAVFGEAKTIGTTCSFLRNSVKILSIPSCIERDVSRRSLSGHRARKKWKTITSKDYWNKNWKTKVLQSDLSLIHAFFLKRERESREKYKFKSNFFTTLRLISSTFYKRPS